MIPLQLTKANLHGAKRLVKTVRLKRDNKRITRDSKTMEQSQQFSCGKQSALLVARMVALMPLRHSIVLLLIPSRLHEQVVADSWLSATAAAEPAGAAALNAWCRMSIHLANKMTCQVREWPMHSGVLAKVQGNDTAVSSMCL